MGPATNERMGCEWGLSQNHEAIACLGEAQDDLFKDDAEDVQSSPVLCEQWPPAPSYVL